MNKTDGIHFDDARGPEDIRIYAIGDVHGRLDLLEKMHEHILGEIARDKPADWRIIHLGDYVDRGPDSRGVIELLMDACKRDSRFVALVGNHDLGFMEFLARPEMEFAFHPIWRGRDGGVIRGNAWPAAPSQPRPLSCGTQACRAGGAHAVHHVAPAKRRVR